MREKSWASLLAAFNEETGADERMMDVEDIARYLNLHIMTVYRMLQSGLLPGRKVGGRWRISKKELDEWLENYTGGLRKQILVVDDDLAIGRLFKRALQPEGCTVEVVQRGEEAVKRVKEQIYDLIFLDLVLPDMDGAQTFARIRKIDSFDPPIQLGRGAVGADADGWLRPSGFALPQTLLRRRPQVAGGRFLDDHRHRPH